jgi:hypothetical protein
MQTTTRGESYRANAVDPENEHRAHWALWVALHDRIAAGHVPTTEEVSAAATPLFDDDHYPSTPYVALHHETCTGRTRWDVFPDGQVAFAFLDSGKGPLLCRVKSTLAVNGKRTAEIWCAIPLSVWSLDHHERIDRALRAIGCTAETIGKAFDSAKLDQSMRCEWYLTAEFDGEDGARGRGTSSHLPQGFPEQPWPSGVMLRWDGHDLKVLRQWGTCPIGRNYGNVRALARCFGLISTNDEVRLERAHVAAEKRRAEMDAAMFAAQAIRDERAKPVPPTSRIVRGSRKARRNARRRVNA